MNIVHVQFFKKFKYPSLNKPPPHSLPSLRKSYLIRSTPINTLYTYINSLSWFFMTETISRNNNCLETLFFKWITANYLFFHLIIWVHFPYVHLTAQHFFKIIFLIVYFLVVISQGWRKSQGLQVELLLNID